MKNIETVLNKAKEKTGSDYKTAQTLGVERQTIYSWRTSHSKPNDLMISKLADITGEDVRVILAALNFETANEEDKEYWANFYQRVTTLLSDNKVGANFVYYVK